VVEHEDENEREVKQYRPEYM
jgi:hypothetical protein